VTRPHWQSRTAHWRRRGCVLTLVVLILPLGKAFGQSEPASEIPSTSPENVQASKDAETTATRMVSAKTIFPNILNDQRKIWTFPVGVAKGEHWKPTLAVAGIAAGLIALDPHDTPYFRKTNDFSNFNKVFSGTVTSIGMAAVPVAFYLVGLQRHDIYAQQTGLFAGESFTDAIILTTAIKAATQRTRPRDIPPNGDFSNTWFKTGLGSSFTGEASFFSGHSIEAFAVATIVARRYGKHRWVPWVAYGLAAVVSFSRVTTQAHFPSDAFVGAALGYSISRFVVLRH
jgi:membrane-associated phospholipid phosphatase